MEKSKENFYLFLDIDGVMWDWPWRIEEIKNGRIRKGAAITEFNPLSVDALNQLIAHLSTEYDCNLVISSTWRACMKQTISTLKKNGVDLPDIIDRTPMSKVSKQRGKEIERYLSDKPHSDNLLIIDDEISDIIKHFSPEQIIKTNMFDESLREHHIKSWIKKHSPESELCK